MLIVEIQWWVSWLTWFQCFFNLATSDSCIFLMKKVLIFSANHEIQVKNDVDNFFLNLMFKTFSPLLLLYQHYEKSLTIKRLGEGQFDPPVVFPNMHLLERERWFFVTFNVIRSHIFPESFIEISQVIKKIWSNWIPTRKQLLSKSPSLLGLRSTKYG